MLHSPRLASRSRRPFGIMRSPSSVAGLWHVVVNASSRLVFGGPRRWSSLFCRFVPSTVPWLLPIACQCLLPVGVGSDKGATLPSPPNAMADQVGLLLCLRRVPYRGGEGEFRLLVPAWPSIGAFRVGPLTLTVTCLPFASPTRPVSRGRVCIAVDFCGR